jgi:hypothetical protein
MICDFVEVHRATSHHWVQRDTLQRRVYRLLAHDKKVIEQLVPDSVWKYELLNYKLVSLRRF